MTSKRRIEACLTIGPPRGPLYDTKGKLIWRNEGWIVHYSIDAGNSQLKVQFDWGCRLMEQVVSLVCTRPNYGGIRWWYLCPKCNQRVATLHKPFELDAFFCRGCHDLTYESSQRSGTQTERYFQTIAGRLGTSTREARRWVRVSGSERPILHEIKRPKLNNTRDRRTGFALALARIARRKGLTFD